MGDFPQTGAVEREELPESVLIAISKPLNQLFWIAVFHTFPKKSKPSVEMATHQTFLQPWTFKHRCPQVASVKLLALLFGYTH